MGKLMKTFIGVDAAKALLMFVLITGAALYGVVTSQTLDGAVPDPVPSTAPPTEFSSGRALEHVGICSGELDAAAPDRARG